MNARSCWSSLKSALYWDICIVYKHPSYFSFSGYQQYDFCVVKELAEPATKLAEQQQEEEIPSQIDKDK